MTDRTHGFTEVISRCGSTDSPSTVSAIAEDGLEGVRRIRPRFAHPSPDSLGTATGCGGSDPGEHGKIAARAAESAIASASSSGSDRRD